MMGQPVVILREVPVSAEFDQLVAQFEQFSARLRGADERLAGIGRMREELAELEAEAVSPDRSVTVVAGPSGAIKDVRFTAAALRGTPEALSAALMSTLHRAVAEAARRQAAIVEDALGDDMNLTEQVLETQAELFGTTPEELRASIEEAEEEAEEPDEQAQADARFRDLFEDDEDR